MKAAAFLLFHNCFTVLIPPSTRIHYPSPAPPGLLKQCPPFSRLLFQMRRLMGQTFAK